MKKTFLKRIKNFILSRLRHEWFGFHIKHEGSQAFKEKAIDIVSPTFCAAKWLNATIWLSQGTTASCHLPMEHKIDVNEIKKNPRALHNTQHKKDMRQMMIDGKRPEECHYCWVMEDMKSGKGEAPVISDRVYKTSVYHDRDIRSVARMNPQDDVVPKRLEIAFDRKCNFACSYCNAAYSSAWVADIRRHGAYKDLVSDKYRTYRDDAPEAEPFVNNNNNPYIEAFWKWWPELANTLDEIRITGGEPTLNPNFWKILDWFEQNPKSFNKRLRFAVNSNLGMNDKVLDRLIKKSRVVKYFHLYTSCETSAEHAEYIRDGLKYKQWQSNLERVLKEGAIEYCFIMMTISALSLPRIVEFLDYLMEVKRRFILGKPALSINMIQYPLFQSPLILPRKLREKYRDDIRYWLEDTCQKKEKDRFGCRLLLTFEIEQIEKLIAYLDSDEMASRDIVQQRKYEHDFRSFFEQYDQRRGKNFKDVFPELAEFYDSIPSHGLSNIPVDEKRLV